MMNTTKNMTHWGTALLLGLTLAGAAVAQDEDTGNPVHRIPAGTQVKVKLLRSLSSEDANVGDTVRAQVAGDDASGLPVGTTFYGRVTSVHPATAKKPGLVYVRFGTRPLTDASATPQVATAHLVGSNAHSEKAGDISIGAGIGGLIGLSRKRKLGDAAAGAALGALGGYAADQAQKKSATDVTLKQGSEITLSLNRPMTVRTEIDAY